MSFDLVPWFTCDVLLMTFSYYIRLIAFSLGHVDNARSRFRDFPQVLPLHSAPKLAFGVVFICMYHIILSFTMEPYVDRRISSGGNAA